MRLGSWISKDKIAEYAAFVIIGCLIFAGTVGRDMVLDYVKSQEWTFSVLQSDAAHSIQINNQLNELRIKTNSSRAVIFMFHNGGFFSSGIPYKKASAVYEAADYFSISTIQLNQNIPLSQMSHVLSLLTKFPDAFYLDVNELEETSWKYALVGENIEGVYLRRLVSGDKMIGYIILSIRNKEDGNDTNNMRFFDQKAKVISSIIEKITR